MANNPHYEGAINRQRQLEAMRRRASGQVSASPGDTMRRMQNKNNTALGRDLIAQASWGNEMQQRFYNDLDKAAIARIQYRQNRARYLLGR